MANRRVEEKLSELHQRGLAKPEAAIPSPYVRAESKPRIKTGGKPGHVDLYPPLPPHEPFTYNLNLHPGGGYDFPGAAIGKGGSIVREIRQRTGTWLVVCDEQGPLDGRRPPADADVYVRISAHDSSDSGLEAIRAAANRVAELWSPTNAGFKPFTVRFGDAIRLQPDWDRLQDDSGGEYLAPPASSGHSSSSSAVKPPPPPPPKLQPQSPTAPAAPAAAPVVVQPLQPSSGLTSAWGQQPPANQQSSAAAVATVLDPLAGARLSDSPFLQQPQLPQQPQLQPETNAPPAAWDPWQQQGARDGSQQPAATGGLGHFSLWDTIRADDPLSGLGGGVGLGMDAMSQAAAPAWPSTMGGASSGATWGAPSVVTGGSWASMASTAAADDRLGAMTVQQQLGQGDHLPSAPLGWPGSGLGQPGALMNTTHNNRAPGGGAADSNSETMKAEDNSDVEVQDLLSLLTCK